MIRNLTLREITEPAWFSAAVYELWPSGNWRFSGYSLPRWMTWNEFMHSIPMGARVRTYSFRHSGERGDKWEQIY